MERTLRRSILAALAALAFAAVLAPAAALAADGVEAGDDFDKWDLENYWIHLDTELYGYTGTAPKLDETVGCYHDGVGYSLNPSDYELVYINTEEGWELEGAPTEVGKYRVYAKGKGAYKGHTSNYYGGLYEIVPANSLRVASIAINPARPSDGERWYVAAGTDFDAALSVQLNGKTVSKNAYTIYYGTYDADAHHYDYSTEQPTETGNYRIYVQANDGGGYIDQSDEFLIYLMAANDLHLATITLNRTSYAYTGSPVALDYGITMNGQKLNADDYSLVYWDLSEEELVKGVPVEPGDYSVEAVPRGSKYTGVTLEEFFTIVGTPGTSIANAKLALSQTSFTYNGKAQRPAVKTVGGKALKAGVDYDARYSNPSSTGAGTYTVAAVGKGAYAGTSAAATYTIAKAANPVAAKAKALTAKAKKKATFPAKKAFAVTGAKGKVTYAKVSGNGKIAVAPGGKVTVKKGLGKGTYSVKVRVSAKGDANWKAKSVTVTLKVKVK